MLKSPAAVEFRELAFRYPSEGSAVLIHPFSLSLPEGSRTLLVGANGVGKSTLLRILAGRHLVPEASLRVFGHSPFHAASVPGVGLIDDDFPLTVDLRVSELLAHPVPGVDPARERELTRLLGVDPAWRMCRVSEGQRRSVQLLIALRRPVRLLLLDEVTAHLDVLMRAEFLGWLESESETQGLTIVYATHILDGLSRPGEKPWPTHLLRMGFSAPPSLSEIHEVREPLLAHCERVIREDL